MKTQLVGSRKFALANATERAVSLYVALQVAPLGESVSATLDSAEIALHLGVDTLFVEPLLGDGHECEIAGWTWEGFRECVGGCDVLPQLRVFVKGLLAGRI
jgi:hypothetical protein